MRRVFITLIDVLLLSCLVAAMNAAAWISGAELWNHRNFAEWKTAPGNIAALHIAEMHGRALATKYEVFCDYSFTVEGARYEGHDFSYPPMAYFRLDEARAAVVLQLGLKHPSWRRAGGETVLEQGRAETAVSVLYDPADPARHSTLVNAFGVGHAGDVNSAGTATAGITFAGALFIDALLLMAAIRLLRQRRSAANQAANN